MREGKSKQTQRIRVRGRQICFQDSPTQRAIFDHSKNVAWVVDDAKKSYSQRKISPGGNPFDALRPSLNDLKKVGPVKLDGVACMWINAATGFLQKSEDKVDGMVLELVDLKIGPQPDRYFSVPKGYKQSTKNSG